MKLRNLFSDSLLYGIPKYLGYVSAILLTPVYLRIFSKAEYGVLEIFHSWNTFIIVVIPFGLLPAIERYYIEEKTPRKKLVGTALSILTLICLIYISGIVLLKNVFLRGFLGEIVYQKVFYLSLVIVVLTVLSNCFLQILKIQLRSIQYAIISITNFLLLTILGFVLVYFFHTGIEGFFYAGVISLLFSNVMSVYYLRNEITIAFDRSIIKLLFTFGIHYLFVSLVFQLFNVIDRYLISHYLSLNDVGIYSLGYKISNFTQFFITPFTLAWMPYAYRIQNGENSQSIFIQVTKIYFLICSILMSILLLYRKELILYFSSEYAESYISIGILAFLNFVMGLNYFFGLGIPFKSKTILYSFIAPVSVLINFMISFIAVKYMGIEGIALGSLVGGIFWTGTLHYYSQKLYKIEFNYLSYAPLLLFPIFFFFFSNTIDSFFDNILIAVAIKAFIVVLMGILLFYFYSPWQAIILFVKNIRK